MRSSSIRIYTRLENKNMDERDIVLNSVLEELKNKDVYKRQDLLQDLEE